MFNEIMNMIRNAFVNDVCGKILLNNSYPENTNEIEKSKIIYRRIHYMRKKLEKLEQNILYRIEHPTSLDIIPE